jgi:hypothetical protein
MASPHRRDIACPNWYTPSDETTQNAQSQFLVCLSPPMAEGGIHQLVKQQASGQPATAMGPELHDRWPS